MTTTSSEAAPIRWAARRRAPAARCGRQVVQITVVPTGVPVAERIRPTCSVCLP
ncbi:hypothetical protein ACGFMK_27915 [Amycolatopsis sp. NPDC049252]|uniref:hypothetical protein n=1 Tax=Amycolatopsis sp. NPDC049252 TaxID=3363933 RepID=UPI0037171520